MFPTAEEALERQAKSARAPGGVEGGGAPGTQTGHPNAGCEGGREAFSALQPALPAARQLMQTSLGHSAMPCASPAPDRLHTKARAPTARLSARCAASLQLARLLARSGRSPRFRQQQCKDPGSTETAEVQAAQRCGGVPLLHALAAQDVAMPVPRRSPLQRPSCSACLPAHRLLPPLPPPLPQAPRAAARGMKASPFTERAQELPPSSSARAEQDLEHGHEDSGLLGQMSPRSRAAAFRRSGSTTEARLVAGRRRTPSVGVAARGKEIARWSSHLLPHQLMCALAWPAGGPVNFQFLHFTAVHGRLVSKESEPPLPGAAAAACASCLPWGWHRAWTKQVAAGATLMLLLPRCRAWAAPRMPLLLLQCRAAAHCADRVDHLDAAGIHRW